MFIRHSLFAFFSFLKLYLRSETKNDRMLGTSARVRVILNDRLKKNHWAYVEKSVEFNTLLWSPRGRARCKELRAQHVPHIAKRHSVVNLERQRLVETKPGRQQSVVAVFVRRTPVISKSGIQALSTLRVNAPEGLACHPIQQVVTRTRLCPRWIGKLAWIVGSAKLVQT